MLLLTDFRVLIRRGFSEVSMSLVFITIPFCNHLRVPLRSLLIYFSLYFMVHLYNFHIGSFPAHGDNLKRPGCQSLRVLGESEVVGGFAVNRFRKSAIRIQPSHFSYIPL